MRHNAKSRITASFLFLSAAFLVLSIPAVAALAPPANLTYFLITNESFFNGEVSPECITFTETELCTEAGGLCGPWTPLAGGSKGAFTFDLLLEVDEGRVHFDGQAEIESRGEGHTLAGVARVEIEGRHSYNLAFVGTPMGYYACQELVGKYAVRNHPRQVPLFEPCLARANFGDPAESPYVLPYPAGKAYRLTGPYCGGTEYGHDNAYAYDWTMPLGAVIVAVAPGVVRNIYDEVPDFVIPEGPDEYESSDNFVWIEHDDGTVSTYGHLQLGGMLVQVGDRVEAGQPIARCGSSGSSEPHLHFRVWDSYPPPQPLAPPEIDYENDISVNFRNTDGPVDTHGGLIWGEIYRALPSQED